MPIKVGDKLPNATFRVMTAEGPKPKTTDEIFKGKKVALFAVPGAFTPTCNNMHMPSFLNNVDAIKAKGVDTIAVTGVNDVFVMEAWKKATGADGKIEFLADGNGEFAKAIDMAFDGSGNGLGTRSKRYSMLVEDGVVKKLNVEDAPGKCDISGGDALLEQTLSASRFGFIAPLAPARAAITVARQFVGALVHGVAGVALDPVPAHVVCACSAASSRFHRSTFFTGFLSAVRQPLRFQPLIQLGDAARACIGCRCSRSTVQGRFSASSAEIAAINSMRLLVVCGLAALQFLFVVAEGQDRAPAARPRIAGAGAVGVDGDALHRSRQSMP